MQDVMLIAYAYYSSPCYNGELSDCNVILLYKSKLTNFGNISQFFNIQNLITQNNIIVISFSYNLDATDSAK